MNICPILQILEVFSSTPGVRLTRSNSRSPSSQALPGNLGLQHMVLLVNGKGFKTLVVIGIVVLNLWFGAVTILLQLLQVQVWRLQRGQKETFLQEILIFFLLKLWFLKGHDFALSKCLAMSEDIFGVPTGDSRGAIGN